MALVHSAPKIITDGLIFCLDTRNGTKSYSGSGTTTIDISNGRVGSLLNGIAYSNTSFVFDGTNDYIAFSNVIGIAPTYNGTIEFISRGTGSLLANERTSSPHGFGGASVTANGNLELWSVTTNSPPYGYSLFSTLSQPTNQFNYYAISATIPNGGTMTGSFMINGQIETVSTTILGGAPAAYSSLDIGRYRNWIYSTTYFTGSLSFLRMYNRRLTDNELLFNYNLTRTRFGL
jgi:hypothetical protein